MRTLWPFRPRLMALLVTSVAGACQSPPPQSPENVERTAFVAQRCPELELGTEPLDPANARVFVEVVDVSRGNLPTPIGRWLDDNAVTIRSSAHLVAFPGVPTSAPWAQCVDAVCADTRRSVSVTANLPQLTSDPIELALRIEEAPAEGAPAQARTLLETTLRATQQEPIVVRGNPELGGGTLVLTAYLLRRFNDLQHVLTCQERQKARQRAL